jgi:uncharacterized secreted protein with C-terminal beta-propeller domain
MKVKYKYILARTYVKEIEVSKEEILKHLQETNPDETTTMKDLEDYNLVFQGIDELDILKVDGINSDLKEEFTEITEVYIDGVDYI